MPRLARRGENRIPLDPAGAVPSLKGVKGRDMPVLPIPQDLNIERLFSWVHAHMLFPDSPANALCMFVRKLVMTELKDVKAGEEVTLPIDWIRALTFGRSGYEVARLEKVRNRCKRR